MGDREKLDQSLEPTTPEPRRRQRSMPTEESLDKAVADLSHVEAKALDMTNKLAQLERESERREHRLLTLIKSFAILMGVIVLASIIFFVFRDVSYQNRMAQTIGDFTAVDRSFAIKDLGREQAKELYRKHMLRVFSMHAKPYSVGCSNSMSPQERTEFIDLAFDMAYDLGSPISPYDAPSIAIIESALDPNCVGSWGEKGILQFKWTSALHAYAMYKTLPDYIQKKYPLDLKNHDDLFNVKVSLTLFYAYFWGIYREFQGKEDWAVLGYHWGLGVMTRLFAEGKGHIPTTMKISDVEYNTYRYYATYKTYKSTFEKGGAQVSEIERLQWEREKKRIRDDEVRLQTATVLIDELRAKQREQNQVIAELLRLQTTYQSDLSSFKTNLVQLVESAETNKNFYSVLEKKYPFLDKTVKDYRVDLIWFRVFYTVLIVLMAAAIAFFLYLTFILYKRNHRR